MSNNNYDRCGIITAKLVDPLSQIISKIIQLEEDGHNAVGFYYHSESSSKCNVILFNTYDNYPVPWMRLGYTMELLLSSPFVTKITFYPLTNTPTALFNRATIISKQAIKNNIEERFRTLIVEAINVNAKTLVDKNLNYTCLLLKMVGITNDTLFDLNKEVITGYNLVNGVLLSLMDIKSSQLTKISSNIITCPLIKTPITITSDSEKATFNDTNYIVEETRREISKVAAVLVDLLTTHDTFRNKLLNNNTNSLLDAESQLVSNLVNGLQNGIISNQGLNQLINNLSQERAIFTNKKLPLSTLPQKEVQIINEDLLCTFNRGNKQKDDIHLKELGDQISNIISSFNNEEAILIDLSNLVSLYNNLIIGSNLERITLSDKRNVSKEAVVIITHDASEVLKLPNSCLTLPIYNNKVSSLSDEELLDILIYLDSLRDSNGNKDNRFINLQNQVTYELGKRKK